MPFVGPRDVMMAFAVGLVTGAMAASLGGSKRIEIVKATVPASSE